MLCCEASLVNHGERALRAVTLRCRCWSCDGCQPMRKARLVKDVAAGQPTKLLTLTTRVVEGADKNAEARRFSGWFAQLIRLIKKRCAGQSVAYFAVREATKQGWPHLHVALRSPYIPWEWLTAQWEQITGSPGVDIRAVWKSKDAAKYLAKYIGKDPHRFGTTKRYWHSRNWFAVRPEPRPESDDWNSAWFVMRVHVCELRQLAWLKGWEVFSAGGWQYFESRAPP